MQETKNYASKTEVNNALDMGNQNREKMKKTSNI